VQSITRAGRRVRRSLGLLSAGALVLTMAPAAVAGAQVPGTDDDTTQVPEARGIAEVCAEPYQTGFADIGDSAHEEAILCLADHGLIRGTSNPSLYAPRRVVTRAQMASFIARTVEFATQHELPESDQGFDDVEEGSEHEDNINKLAGVGIAQGRDEGFAPNRPVTRGQMATFIVRALDYVDNAELDGSQPPTTDDDYFTDDEGHAHEDAINQLAAQGIVQGFDSETYGPNRSVFRDQMASFLARSLDYASVEDLLRAPGDYVTNLRTGTTYTTISAALAAADEDDHLEAQGGFAETATVTTDGVAIHSTPFGPVSLEGSFVVNADDVLIAGFDISEYTATDNAGIYIQGGDGILIEDNTFFGVDGTPPAATLNGLSIATGSDAVVEIVGNAFVNNNIGVYSNPGADVTVEDNLFSGNNISLGLDTEVWTVSGNDFADAHDTGVEIFQFTLGSTMTGNDFGAAHDKYVCAPNNQALLVTFALGNSFEETPQTNEGNTCLVPPADDNS
jgi:hypothetical protein